MDLERETGQVFNGSIATLQRINDLLIKTTNFRLIGRARVYVRCLGLLMKELHPFLKKDEKTYVVDQYKKLNTDLNKSKVNNLYNYIEADTMELWIRDKLHEKGLLMAKPEDPGFATK